MKKPPIFKVIQAVYVILLALWGSHVAARFGPEVGDAFDRWVALAFVLWGIVLAIYSNTGKKIAAKVKYEYRKNSTMAPAAVFVVFGCVGLLCWYGINKTFDIIPVPRATDNNGGIHNDAVGYNVTFRAEFINMSRRVDKSPLWVLYRSSYGDTISPVALLVFMDIQSIYSHPVRIVSYSMSIKTAQCGWIYLSPIPGGGVRLLFHAVESELDALYVLKLDDKDLSNVWERDIPGRESQHGMLLFDTKIACDIHAGSIVQFRFEVTDSEGHKFTYDSNDTEVLKNFIAGSSIGTPNRPAFETVGQTVDARRAYRRLFSDPIPDVMDKNPKGSVVITNTGRVGIIVLNDGAYTTQ